MNQTVPVNEGNDDVLDIDVLMKFSTRTQKRVQGLKVELIWENLKRQDYFSPYYLSIYETNMKVEDSTKN